MKLQEKTSLILVVMLILLLTLISLFVSVVSLSSYSALEHQYVLRDVDLAMNRLHDEYDSLSLVVADWGQWDDTYDYVNGHKPDYITNNLVPEAYRTLRINLVVMTNTKGEIVYAGAYDLRNHTMVDVPDGLREQLTPENPLLSMSDPMSTTNGVLMIGNTPMIVASRPIIRSDFSGSPQGVVIMGRNLDDDETTYLAKLIRPTIRFIRIDDPVLSSHLHEALLHRQDPAAGIVQPLENNRVAGYALIPDVYGKNVLVLETLQSRDIYQQGIASTVQFVFIVLGAGLLLGIIMLLILDRLVLSRVSSLSRQVHDIGRPASLSRRMNVEGDDEFSDLSGDINRMLDTIEHAHQGLLQSEARFRELAELLPQTIFELDLEGNLTYVNHAGFEIFGIDSNNIGPGENIRKYLIPEDIERMRRESALIRSGATSEGEIYHLRRRDGMVMSARVFTAPIHRNDQIVGFRGIAVDITDSVNLEEALIESQEYLQTLLWSVKVGIIVVDAATHAIVDANPAALEMIGRTKDQIVDHVCHHFICPNEAGRCPITDLGQTVDNAERDLLTSDGERIPVIKYVVPVMLQGRTCLLETFIDNTTRKKIERDLRESRDLIAGILQASPVGVFRLDAGGCVTFVNDTFTRITGAALDTIRGKNLIDILHPDDREQIRDALAESIRNKTLVKAETRLIHANGSVYWLLGQAIPLFNEQGSLSGWVGTIDNITDQKAMEVALKESQERLSGILSASPVGVFETKADGTLLYVNTRWEEMVGMTLASMKTSRSTIFHTPLDSTRISKDLWMKFQARMRPQAEVRFMRPDGTSIWFFGQAMPLYDPDGNIRGYVGTITDITDRKRDEDAIHLANKKLNLMNDITRHDILNTLTGIFGLIDMAVASDNKEELLQLLEQIKDVGRVIQRQITFTRDYQGVGVKAPIWQDVQDVINRATASFIRPGLTLIVDVEGMQVFADPLLEKVFYNLADNALRYGEHTTRIRFYFRIADNFITLVCEDNGAGIAEAEKEHIFEQGVGKNTGMGLFLTREILMITGISILETGIPGNGALFEIRIPNGMWRFRAS